MNPEYAHRAAQIERWEKLDRQSVNKTGRQKAKAGKARAEEMETLRESALAEKRAAEEVVKAQALAKKKAQADAIKAKEDAERHANEREEQRRKHREILHKKMEEEEEVKQVEELQRLQAEFSAKRAEAKKLDDKEAARLRKIQEAQEAKQRKAKRLQGEQQERDLRAEEERIKAEVLERARIGQEARTKREAEAKGKEAAKRAAEEKPLNDAATVLQNKSRQKAARRKVEAMRVDAEGPAGVRGAAADDGTDGEKPVVGSATNAKPPPQIQTSSSFTVDSFQFGVETGDEGDQSAPPVYDENSHFAVGGGAVDQLALPASGDKEHVAATVLQSKQRQKLAIAVVGEKKEQKQAATVLQSKQRQKQAKLTVAERRREAQQKEDEDELRIYPPEARGDDVTIASLALRAAEGAGPWLTVRLGFDRKPTMSSASSAGAGAGAGVSSQTQPNREKPNGTTAAVSPDVRKAGSADYDAAMAAFYRADVDGSGEISAEEQLRLFSSQGIDVHDPQVREYIEAQWNKLDGDASGGITLEEYMTAAGFGEEFATEQAQQEWCRQQAAEQRATNVIRGNAGTQSKATAAQQAKRKEAKLTMSVHAVEEDGSLTPLCDYIPAAAGVTPPTPTFANRTLAHPSSCSDRGLAAAAAGGLERVTFDLVLLDRQLAGASASSAATVAEVRALQAQRAPMYQLQWNQFNAADLNGNGVVSKAEQIELFRRQGANVEDPKIKKYISRQWRKFGGNAVKKNKDEITFAEYMRASGLLDFHLRTLRRRRGRCVRELQKLFTSVVGTASAEAGGSTAAGSRARRVRISTRQQQQAYQTLAGTTVVAAVRRSSVSLEGHLTNTRSELHLLEIAKMLGCESVELREAQEKADTAAAAEVVQANREAQARALPASGAERAAQVAAIRAGQDVVAAVAEASQFDTVGVHDGFNSSATLAAAAEQGTVSSPKGSGAAAAAADAAGDKPKGADNPDAPTVSQEQFITDGCYLAGLGLLTQLHSRGELHRSDIAVAPKIVTGPQKFGDGYEVERHRVPVVPTLSPADEQQQQQQQGGGELLHDLHVHDELPLTPEEETARAVAVAAAAKHAVGTNGSNDGVERDTTTRRPSIFGHVVETADTTGVVRETRIFSAQDLKSPVGKERGAAYMKQLQAWIHGPAPFSTTAGLGAGFCAAGAGADPSEHQRLRHFGWGAARPLLVRVWEEVEEEAEEEAEKEQDAISKLVNAMISLHLRPIDLWELLDVGKDKTISKGALKEGLTRFGGGTSSGGGAGGGKQRAAVGTQVILTGKEVEELVAPFDTGGDGDVAIKEWKEVVDNHYRSRREVLRLKRKALENKARQEAERAKKAAAAAVAAGEEVGAAAGGTAGAQPRRKPRREVGRIHTSARLLLAATNGIGKARVPLYASDMTDVSNRKQGSNSSADAAAAAAAAGGGGGNGSSLKSMDEGTGRPVPPSTGLALAIASPNGKAGAVSLSPSSSSASSPTAKDDQPKKAMRRQQKKQQQAEAERKKLNEAIASAADMPALAVMAHLTIESADLRPTLPDAATLERWLTTTTNVSSGLGHWHALPAAARAIIAGLAEDEKESADEGDASSSTVQMLRYRRACAIVWEGLLRQSQIVSNGVETQKQQQLQLRIIAPRLPSDGSAAVGGSFSGFSCLTLAEYAAGAGKMWKPGLPLAAPNRQLAAQAAPPPAGVATGVEALAKVEYTYPWVEIHFTAALGPLLATLAASTAVAAAEDGGEAGEQAHAATILQAKQRQKRARAAAAAQRKTQSASASEAGKAGNAAGKGKLLALPGTVQGENGWYQRDKDKAVYSVCRFDVTGEVWDQVGAPVTMKEWRKQQQIYKDLVSMAIHDGHIGEVQEKRLAQKREKYGVSEEVHQQLLAELSNERMGIEARPRAVTPTPFTAPAPNCILRLYRVSVGGGVGAGGGSAGGGAGEIISCVWSSPVSKRTRCPRFPPAMVLRSALVGSCKRGKREKDKRKKGWFGMTKASRHDKAAEAAEAVAEQAAEAVMDEEGLHTTFLLQLCTITDLGADAMSSIAAQSAGASGSSTNTAAVGACVLDPVVEAEVVVVGETRLSIARMLAAFSAPTTFFAGAGAGAGASGGTAGALGPPFTAGETMPIKSMGGFRNRTWRMQAGHLDRTPASTRELGPKESARIRREWQLKPVVTPREKAMVRRGYQLTPTQPGPKERAILRRGWQLAQTDSSVQAGLMAAGFGSSGSSGSAASSVSRVVPRRICSVTVDCVRLLGSHSPCSLSLLESYRCYSAAVASRENTCRAEQRQRLQQAKQLLPLASSSASSSGKEAELYGSFCRWMKEEVLWSNDNRLRADVGAVHLQFSTGNLQQLISSAPNVQAGAAVAAAGSRTAAGLTPAVSDGGAGTAGAAGTASAAGIESTASTLSGAEKMRKKSWIGSAMSGMSGMRKGSQSGAAGAGDAGAAGGAGGGAEVAAEEKSARTEAVKKLAAGADGAVTVVTICTAILSTGAVDTVDAAGAERATIATGVGAKLLWTSEPFAAAPDGTILTDDSTTSTSTSTSTSTTSTTSTSSSTTSTSNSGVITAVLDVTTIDGRDFHLPWQIAVWSLTTAASDPALPTLMVADDGSAYLALAKAAAEAALLVDATEGPRVNCRYTSYTLVAEQETSLPELLDLAAATAAIKTAQEKAAAKDAARLATEEAEANEQEATIVAKQLIDAYGEDDEERYRAIEESFRAADLDASGEITLDEALDSTMRAKQGVDVSKPKVRAFIKKQARIE
jgi:Ca2+-binding EF-hand superfamily protein